MSIPMVCPRDYTLRTRNGHTIKFAAGEPTDVPEALYAEALAKNIIPVERKSDDQPIFGMVHAEITGTLRDAMIYQAIDEVVKRNQTEDFSGGGVPKAAALSAIIGLSLSASEASRFYTNYRQIIGENEPLPTHPKVEVVRELQALTSRKQLEEFAEDHGIGIPKAKGKSLKELKELLLNSVINQMTTPPAADSSEYVKPATLMHD